MPPILTAARPTLVIDGAESPALAAALLELTVVESVAGLCQCEAAFGNRGTAAGQAGFLFFDRQLLEFGKALQVKSGPSDTLFDGRIIAIEAGFPATAPPTIRVRAADRLDDLRMTRRTRTFEDASDADVIQRIAGDHGLVPHVDISGPTHRILAQVNQSDLAFLLDRTRAIDAELWVDGATLHAQSHTRRANRAAVNLGYGAELLQFSVVADLSHQRSRTIVAGWDVTAKRTLCEEAAAAVLASELDGRESGPALLDQAFGERKETLVHTVPLSSDEARARAASYFKTMARRFLVGQGVATASAQIRPGRRLNLAGLGPLFSGTYYVTESRQLFDLQNGMRTAFTVESAGLGRN